jgi:2-keto-3-deoxy-L-rhamnonate aldolase RhmA
MSITSSITSSINSQNPPLTLNLSAIADIRSQGKVLIGPSDIDTYPGLFVKGDAEIKGTLTVGGQEITKTIDERLSAIEERLGILRVDEKLADRWAELGELRKRYRELEQECWEKDEIIRLLKGKS